MAGSISWRAILRAGATMATRSPDCRYGGRIMLIITAVGVIYCVCENDIFCVLTFNLIFFCIFAISIHS